LVSSESTLDSKSLLKFIRQGHSFSGREPNCAFLNTGNGDFADVSAAAGLNLDDDGRAIGIVDWDVDGDLDFWVTNRNGPQLRFMRNGMPAKHNWVSLRLQGTKCNRDGIGARIDLWLKGDEERRLSRTLSAGNGYLAQSSKWIHFGLGRASEIDRCVVHWPDGSQQSFSDIKPNQRYDVEQGKETVASRKIDRSANHNGTPSPIESPAEDSTIHALFASRIPLPKMTYLDLSNEPQACFNGRPVLINLWASWCNPCLEELAEFAKHSGELASKLDVVALSVDGIDAQAAPDGAELSAVLEKLGFRFRAGQANANLIETLQLFHNRMFDLHLPMPIPTSVLVDAEGRLAAIYKGPVKIERVLEDLAKANDPNASQNVELCRHQATRFAGRWNAEAIPMPLVPFLNDLVTHDLLPEADDFVRRMGTVSKSKLLPAIVRLGMAYYRKGDQTKAREHFLVVNRMDPKFTGAENSAGRYHQSRGETGKAVRFYQAALRRNSKSVPALNNLAWLLATSPDETIRRLDDAMNIAKLAAQLTNDSEPNVLDTLAAAYASNGDFKKAQEVAREAISISSARGDSVLAKELRERLSLYENNQAFRSKP